MYQGIFGVLVLDHRISCDNYLDACRGDRSDRAPFSALKTKSVSSVSRTVVLRKELFSDISCYWYGTGLGNSF